MQRSILILLGAVCTLASVWAAESGVVGGFSPLDVNSAQVTDLVGKAVKQFNAQSNDPNQEVLVKVVSASSQVVAGVNYKIVVELGQSDCKKGATCANQKVTNQKQYQIDVFSQPWNNVENIKITPL